MDADRKTTAFTAFTTGDIGALNAHFHLAAERGIMPLVAQNFRMQRFDTATAMFIRFRKKAALRYGDGERDCAGDCKDRPRLHVRGG